NRPQYAGVIIHTQQYWFRHDRVSILGKHYRRPDYLDTLIRYGKSHSVAQFVLLGHLSLLGGRFIQSRMDLQLQGKRALVTGSTAGIGLAIARGLAREGAGVIINGRTAQRVDQSVAALNKAGFRARSKVWPLISEPRTERVQPLSAFRKSTF